MLARGLIGVLAAGVLLGCSTSTGSAPTRTPTPTPTPAPAYTIDQLREAVPPVEEIDAVDKAVDKVVYSCPGDDAC